MKLERIALGQIIIISVTPCPGSSAAHLHMFSLSLPSRALPLRALFSIQTPSNVLARHFAGATVPTRRDTDTLDRAQPTTNSSMDQITDILDDADLSTSPRSNNFTGKPLVVSTSRLSPLSAPGTLSWRKV